MSAALRVVADPSITVRDLENLMQGYVSATGKDDICNMFLRKGWSRMSWQQEPNGTIMSVANPLINMFLDIVPNTKVNSSKLGPAIRSLFRRKIFKLPARRDGDTRDVDQIINDLSDDLDLKIRIVLSWYRVCASNDEGRVKALSVLTAAEITSVEKALKKVQVPKLEAADIKPSGNSKINQSSSAKKIPEVPHSWCQPPPALQAKDCKVDDSPSHFAEIQQDEILMCSPSPTKKHKKFLRLQDLTPSCKVNLDIHQQIKKARAEADNLILAPPPSKKVEDEFGISFDEAETAVLAAGLQEEVSDKKGGKKSKPAKKKVDKKNDDEKKTKSQKNEVKLGKKTATVKESVAGEQGGAAEEKDWHTMYYRSTSSVAIRRKFGLKNQIFQINGLPREDLESICNDCVAAFKDGTVSEADGKEWCKAKVQEAQPKAKAKAKPKAKAKAK